MRRIERTDFMFTKEMLADVVVVSCTFNKLYKDEDGKPITFEFKFKMETGEIIEKLDRFGLATGRTAAERNLERFCLLLDQPPAGFGDFPQNGKSVYENAREYFGDTRMESIVSNALVLYNRAVSPQELFRSV
jgi:hypothetical protein